jgi:Mg-chelatase subunit ChlD
VSAETSTIHSELVSDHAAISDTIETIGDEAIIGGTNISAGINDGISVLTNTDTVRAHAFKVMVLMTDGQWNAGGDPITFANQAAAQGIVIHTITFSAGANQTDMQAVADATGGRFYHAPDAAALNAAFADIAYSVPVLLIQ